MSLWWLTTQQKKKDAAIARKAAGGIKKLITPYNQASVAEAKEAKSSN